MSNPTPHDPKVVEAIASVAHAVNDAYRLAIGEEQKGPWQEQTPEFKSKHLQGVMNHLMNPGGIDPQKSHDLWLSHKLRTGWRYGPVQDDAAKVHPCLLPYSELPDSQRAKDYIFVAVCNSLGEILVPKAPTPVQQAAGVRRAYNGNGVQKPPVAQQGNHA